MSAAEEAPPPAPATPRLRRPAAPMLRAGAILSLVLLLVAFISIVWTPYPTAPAGVPEQLLDPSALHWLGTDQQGRDLVSMTMRGMLTSFVVAGAIGVLSGVPLGFALAAWRRGPGERIDLPLLFPAVIVAILLAARLEPGAVCAMLAIGIAQAALFASATAAAMARLGRRSHVDAARLAGMTAWEAAKRHVFPELSHLLLVQLVLQLAAGILAEAALAYVGLGTQPPGTSLGLMLREAQPLMLMEPLLVLVPGVAVATLALGLNLVAHGLAKWLGVNHAAA